MAIIDRAEANVSRAGLAVPGDGAAPPPGGPGETGGSPDGDRARLMLAIYNARGGAVSLERLQRGTGFARERLWRTFEDLEDLGYIEVLDEDPRGPVVRWMDRRSNANDQVFASTFVELTDAGRNSLELAALVARQGAGKRRASGLRSRLAGDPARDAGVPAWWRNRSGKDTPGEDLSRLTSVAHGTVAVCTALLGCVLALMAAG